MADTYYKYYLYNSSFGQYELKYAPQEWQSDECFFERSTTYWGIFRSFSTKELTFIKDDVDYLESVFSTFGTEGECKFTVDEYDTSTYSYNTRYVGYIDFSTRKKGYYNANDFYIKLQIIDNQFVNKVKNKESVNISLSKLIDLNGNEIVPFSYEGRNITIPQRIDTLTGQVAGPGYGLTQNSPWMLVYSRQDESLIDVSSPSDPTSEDAAFFKPAYAVSSLACHVAIVGTMTFTPITGVSIELRKYKSDGTLLSSTVIDTRSTTTSPETLTYNISGDYTITDIKAGNYITIGAYFSGSLDSQDISYTIDVSYPKIVTDEVVIKAYPYYEAFLRILQSITGQENPFYSKILGRTDAELNPYASDGALSAGVVTNGLLLRSYLFTDDGVALNVSLSDLFKSLNSIYPICLGYEFFDDGGDKIRIEEMSYAFDRHYIITLDNCTNISEEIANDLTFSDINIGFNKAEQAYLLFNGQYEYNQKTEFNTIITTQNNSFEKISPYRADSNAVVDCLIKSKYVAKGEDTNYDDNNFLLSIIHSGWQIKRKEGYTSITGVPNSDNAYNVDYSPARSLRHWGSFLRGCLEKYTSSIISFIKSDKNSSMSSKLTTESTAVTENADIFVTQLATPFFENIYYSFDCVITNEILTLLNGYSAGKPGFYYAVRFRNNASENYKYGWIMKVQSKKSDNQGLGNFKLLKCSSYTDVEPLA